MSWWNDLTGTVGRGLDALVGVGERDVIGPVKAALSGVQKIGSLLVNFYATGFKDEATALSVIASLFTGNYTALLPMLQRITSWFDTHRFWPLEKNYNAQIARLWAALKQLRTWALQMITRYNYLTRMWAFYLVLAERRARQREFQEAEAYTRQRVTWVLQTVQREAASGYATGYGGRVTLLQKILDDAVSRDPLVRDVVSRLTGLLIDLAGVEDPVARWLTGWLLSKLADDLGIDKAIGDLASSLAGPLLGQPHPRNLHDVIQDISARLAALEAQWAEFMADGGPQILQAGEEWKSITSLLADVGLLGFAAAAITDPATTARDLSAVIRPVGTTTISRIADFLARG